MDSSMWGIISVKFFDCVRAYLCRGVRRAMGLQRFSEFGWGKYNRLKGLGVQLEAEIDGQAFDVH